MRLLPKQNEFRSCNTTWAAARGGKGSGKTTAVAWWLIQRMEDYPRANHYVAGATFPQLREGSFQTVAGILESVLGWERGKDFQFREKSQSPQIVFPYSGATLNSLTAEQGDKINSIEFQTLVCEEPQTWERGEEAFQTMTTRLRHSQQSSKLYPDMIPSGRASFNPPTKAHWLFEQVERRWPKAGWPCWQFSTRDNYLLPGRESYIAMLESQLPEHLWASEIDGDWRAVGEEFFPLKDLEEATLGSLTSDLVEIGRDGYGRLAHCEVRPGGRTWFDCYPESRYVHFWDLADKQDWTVGITLDCTYADRLTVVEFERFQKTGWQYVYQRIRDRHARYQIGRLDSETSSSGGKTYIDATGVGAPVLDELQDIRAEGLVFTATTKPEALAGLQSVLSTHELKWPMIPVMFDEHKFYERDDKELVQDCVMSMAGAVHFGKRKATPRFSFDF